MIFIAFNQIKMLRAKNKINLFLHFRIKLNIDYSFPNYSQWYRFHNICINLSCYEKHSCEMYNLFCLLLCCVLGVNHSADATSEISLLRTF